MTDSNEWYTPRHVIDAARDVMGSIDLDPASCEVANRVVKAKRFYTKDQDGLSKPWVGNVWCNPPYGRGLIQPFVEKFIRQLDVMEQGMFLVNASVGSQWFHSLLECDMHFCIFEGRQNFWHPEKASGGNRYDQVIFYNGNNSSKFVDVFEELGKVCVLA